jgi:tetratricopeptide (TPR) repeat protein
MVLDGDGSEVDWIVGYGPPPEKFVEKLERILKGIDTFKVISEGYAKDPQNVETVFKLAQKYDDRYDEEKAKELYQEVLTLDPGGKKGTTEYEDQKVTFSEYAEYSLGALAVFARPMDAEPMKAFIKKHPNSPLEKSAYQRLSYYYGYQAPKEEAKAFFEEYTSKYPDDPYVLSSYVTRIIRDKDNLDKGIELAEKIKEMMKYNPSPRYNKDLAELYMLEGEEDKANEAFGKDFMEGQVSNLSYYLTQYAEFWSKYKKNTDSAEEMIELAIKLNPDRWYYRQSAANIYLQLEKEDKALEVFGAAFAEKNKDDPDLLNSYAWFWANQEKNLESALDAAKRSVKMAESPYNLDTLAMVYQKMEDYDEAIKAEEKAIAVSEEEVKARFQNRLQQIKKAMEEKKEKKEPESFIETAGY